MLEDRSAHGGNVVAHGYSGQRIAVIKCCFADVLYRFAQGRSGQRVTIIEGVTLDGGNRIRKGNLPQRIAAVESLGRNMCQAFRQRNGFQGITISESALVECCNVVGNLYFFHLGRTGKCILRDFRNTGSPGDFLQIRAICQNVITCAGDRIGNDDFLQAGVLECCIANARDGIRNHNGFKTRTFSEQLIGDRLRTFFESGRFQAVAVVEGAVYIAVGILIQITICGSLQLLGNLDSCQRITVIECMDAQSCQVF